MVGGLETGEPPRSRNPHGSLCDKAAPPFFMQVHTCSQAGADFAPSVWCYCRFRDAQVLRNRVQVAWRRGEEGDLQIVILENGLAFASGMRKQLLSVEDLLADMHTAAGS